MSYGWSKWSKYNLMKKSASVRGHLPETRRLSKEALSGMLAKYGKVIVKPSASYGGSGVIQVEALGNDQYRIHAGTSRKTYNGSEALWEGVRKRSRSGYIVQQRIALAKVNGRPYDLRVMAQRHRGSSEWRITGQLAKVAGRGHIITNVRRSGGYVTSATSAFAKSVSSRSSSAILADVKKTSLSTARILHRYFPRQREMGIDVGVDTSGRVWVIEANFTPALSLFNKLKDKTMYHRILSYHRN